jgi:hypothetical protein
MWSPEEVEESGLRYLIWGRNIEGFENFAVNDGRSGVIGRREVVRWSCRSIDRLFLPVWGGW